jgi:hypothetical protein
LHVPLDRFQVEVAVGDGTVTATVSDFPVYDPQKTRPRS